jgi:Flp pilus assembly pilin Flp
MMLRLVKNERGAASVEYALLAVLIAAVVVGTVAALGQRVLMLFQKVVF